MLYCFFWVIPRRMNFTCRLFGTPCLFHLHRLYSHHQWRWKRNCSEESALETQTPGNHPEEKIQCVPLATEPGNSLIILPLMRILQRNLKRTTDTFLFISHTTNVLLFKFRCNILIGVRIIKEMPGSVASGTHCTTFTTWRKFAIKNYYVATFLLKEVTLKAVTDPSLERSVLLNFNKHIWKIP